MQLHPESGDIQESYFRFDKFIVKESHIIRKAGTLSGNCRFDIKPKGTIDDARNIFALELEAKIADQNGVFEVMVSIVAWFVFNKETKKENLTNYFYTNAPAIVFPYIRAYISALTALSGLPAVNLPLINMTNIGKELEENTVKIDIQDEPSPVKEF